ncbi:hypothetical protein VTJ04DRAFT_10404 [Mycothermus thermophilus]|uniref:uncharacterized protein n=1 Tax=Humicola insolens TaxID=85995 RepID=UPI0037421D53
MLQELRGSRLENGGQRSKLASFQQSIRNAIWGRSRIKELQKTVDQYRKDLVLCLQAITREEQSHLVRYVNELRYSNLKLVRDHQAKTQEIIDAVDEIHAKTTEILDKDGDARLHLQRISKELERLKSCSGRDYVAEDMIVDSLYFESIGLRHESISAAHQETFRWILHRSSNNGTKEYPECSLLDWLQTGDGLYWVSGKTGFWKINSYEVCCKSFYDTDSATKMGR